MKYDEKYPQCTARPCDRYCGNVHTHQLVDDKEILKLHSAEHESCKECGDPAGWVISAWTKYPKLKFDFVCSEECYAKRVAGIGT